MASDRGIGDHAVMSHPRPSNLNVLLDEATLVDLDIDDELRTLRLRLRVLAAPESDGGQPERTVLLHDLSRVAVWLRRQEFVPDPNHRWSRPGAIVRVPRDVYPRESLRDLAEFRSAISGWLGWEIYGQPAEAFDLPEPAWIGFASLDVRLAATRPMLVRSLDLGLDTTPDAPDQMIDMRFEFGRAELLLADGTVDDDGATEARVREWWRRMDAGETGGQYGIIAAGE